MRHWEKVTASSIPWNHAGWLETAAANVTAAVTAAGCEVIGSLAEAKSWGPAHLATRPIREGTLWIKHAYRLPPGEEVVFAALADRHAQYVPDVVATWPGGVAMHALHGTELGEQVSLEAWGEAAGVIATIAAVEEAHATEWLRLGVRDRHPPAPCGAGSYPLRTASDVSTAAGRGLPTKGSNSRAPIRPRHRISRISDPESAPGLP